MNDKRDKESMNQTPKTVRELGIMMTARDDVLNERLSSINDNVSRLAESVKQLAESKADAEELKALIVRVELMQGNYLSKSEAKIGAGVMTAVITVIGFMVDLIVRVVNKP